MGLGLQVPLDTQLLVSCPWTGLTSIRDWNVVSGQ